MFVVIIVRTPGFQLIDEGIHNNARIHKMIHKLFQRNQVVSRVNRMSLNFLISFSYDRVLQVCYTVGIRKTDIIVDKVEKIVYHSWYFNGFPLKFGIVIGGSLMKLLFVVCKLKLCSNGIVSVCISVRG